MMENEAIEFDIGENDDSTDSTIESMFSQFEGRRDVGSFDSEKFHEHRVNLGDSMIITRTTRASNDLSGLTSDSSINWENEEESCQELYPSKSAAPDDPAVQLYEATSVVVPDLKNVEEIFQLLSQKIAKYCQVLADLTNCEVFYKAQLPDVPKPPEPNKRKKSTYVKRNKRLNDGRTLYWGTYRMLFEYSHNQGIIFDKERDCLIKINRSHMTHLNHLIEEILKDPQIPSSQPAEQAEQTSPPAHDVQPSTSAVQAETVGPEVAEAAAVNAHKPDPKEVQDPRDEIEFKECRVFVNRLDEASLAEYYDKFERKHSKRLIEQSHEEAEDEICANLLPKDEELFSDHNHIILDPVTDDPEADTYHRCELCAQESNLPLAFKYLTQLKLHELRVHKKLNLSSLELFQNDVTSTMINLSEIYSCSKCNKNNFKTHLDYIKHLISCFYPNVYTCKTCHRTYDNYRQLYFHQKYIHADIVYMCPFCDRKFQSYSDLIEHDRIIHFNSESKSWTGTLACDYCSETAFGSREQLYAHYKKQHLSKESVSGSSSTLDESFEDSSTHNTVDELDVQVNKKELIRGLLDRKHKCRYCQIRFYTKGQLKEHENSAHRETVLFCPVCDKRFVNKDRLSAHMKCHSEPSLECKVCGKKFRRLCNLYNHELVHGLTEHAFMLCKFCGRGFRSRRDYNNHVIANHREHLVKNETSPAGSTPTKKSKS